MAYLLSHYLAEAVARDASRTAVVTKRASLTYGELDSESDRVARALADAGIGRGSRVGICMPKSARGVAAMHGALKAGAAYVPVDPAAPPARGGYILADCGVRALVTTARKLNDYRDALAGLPALELVILTDDEQAVVPPAAPRTLAWSDLPVDGPLSATPPGIETDPAYLLYTSGSTGNPKGVILSHRHARTFVDWGRDTFGVHRNDRLSNHAPFHFDLSVFDIYVALASGATVSVVPDDITAFPMELAKWIDNDGITTWYSVPSALVRLLLHGKMDRFAYEKLRTILYAGEVFPVKYLRDTMAALPRARFFNLYGPTETNVCTWYPLPERLADDVTDIPIGVACANTDVFAIDDEAKEVQPGGTGELLVRGPAVMLGYWGLPERTKQSLIANPLQPAYSEPAYRTGDIVRYGEDGLWWFVGRRDHMVKSRGYRIELGDIEQALYQHPDVREAVIIALPDDEVGNLLHAAVAPAEGKTLSAQQLQAWVAERLPRYMVPESVMVAGDLPKTSTGKIDRVSVKEQIHTLQQRETSVR